MKLIPSLQPKGGSIGVDGCDRDALLDKRLIALSSWMLVLGTIRVICAIADLAGAFFHAAGVGSISMPMLSAFVAENQPFLALGVVWPLCLGIVVRRTRWLELLPAAGVSFLILSLGGLLESVAEWSLGSYYDGVTIGSFHLMGMAAGSQPLPDAVRAILGVAQLGVELATGMRCLLLHRRVRRSRARAGEPDEQEAARRGRLGRIAIYASVGFLVLMIRLRLGVAPFKDQHHVPPRMLFGRGGVVITGKLTQQGTDRPVGRAGIHFFHRDSTGRPAYVPDVVTDQDGRFETAVPPGQGYALVFAPSRDCILKVIGSGMLSGSARIGGTRTYAHDIIAYQVKAGESPHQLVATLQPGMAVKGHVVGPNGQTVEEAVILTSPLTAVDIEPRNLTWRHGPSLRVHDGRFELRGLDPAKTTSVYFLDSAHRCGTAIELSGNQAGWEVIVRLQPCGQAKARFIGPTGKPLAKLGTLPYIELLITPGPSQSGFLDRVASQLEADASFMGNVDPRHYPDARKPGQPRGPATDNDGRITFVDLIPGALYRIRDDSTIMDPKKGAQVRRDFTVNPGETLELGDIVIEDFLRSPALLPTLRRN